MIAHARATPFLADDVNRLKLSGEGEHALLKTPIDAMDILRLHFYAANQVSRAIELSQMAKAAGGDAETAAQA